VFLICVPNILGLDFLAPIVKREMESYFARIESGEIKRFKN
jgi:AGCS family alanine or glycine:cation symporter